MGCIWLYYRADFISSGVNCKRHFKKLMFLKVLLAKTVTRRGSLLTDLEISITPQLNQMVSSELDFEVDFLLCEFKKFIWTCCILWSHIWINFLPGFWHLCVLFFSGLNLFIFAFLYRQCLSTSLYQCNSHQASFRTRYLCCRSKNYMISLSPRPRISKGAFAYWCTFNCGLASVQLIFIVESFWGS